MSAILKLSIDRANLETVRSLMDCVADSGTCSYHLFSDIYWDTLAADFCARGESLKCRISYQDYNFHNSQYTVQHRKPVIQDTLINTIKEVSIVHAFKYIDNPQHAAIYAQLSDKLKQVITRPIWPGNDKYDLVKVGGENACIKGCRDVYIWNGAQVELFLFEKCEDIIKLRINNISEQQRYELYKLLKDNNVKYKECKPMDRVNWLFLNQTE